MGVGTRDLNRSPKNDDSDPYRMNIRIWSYMIRLGEYFEGSLNLLKY